MRYRYGIIKTDNGLFRLVRDEGAFAPMWIPYSGIPSKYKIIERKTLKGVQTWAKKHGIEQLEIVK